MFKKLLFPLIFFITLIACESERESTPPPADDIDTTHNLKESAMAVARYLKDKNLEGVAEYVHPEKGVLISMYSYIDHEDDQIFTKEEFAGLAGNNTQFRWGVADGTGDPVEKTFSQYYEDHLWTHDYTSADTIAENRVIGRGNTIVNIDEAFPQGEFVEFHFKGFEEQYEGMDWRSLRLVFEKFQGRYHLVAIINDQWTI